MGASIVPAFVQGTLGVGIILNGIKDPTTDLWTLPITPTAINNTAMNWEKINAIRKTHTLSTG